MITKIGVVGGTLVTGLMDWRIAVAWVGVNLLVCLTYVAMTRLYPEGKVDFARFDESEQLAGTPRTTSAPEEDDAVKVKLQRQSLYDEAGQ